MRGPELSPDLCGCSINSLGTYDRPFITALLVALALTGCRSALVPSHDFDEEPPPAAPDYTLPTAWAALPDRADDADVVAEGETDRQADAAVDVFFLHPTTYYSNDHWNQPLDDEAANKFTDEKVLRNQASAFNEAGRVFAPRYRQATLGAYFSEDKDNSLAALNLAYGDVAAAFRHFLEHHNDNRPIILASHSQGTYHAARLLAEFFAGEQGAALRERLVAAYLVGFSLPEDHFERTLAPIPPCRGETDTGCVIAYGLWVEGAQVDELRNPKTTIPYGGAFESNEGKRRHCTNPLLWTTDSTRGTNADHVGAVRFEDDERTAIPDRNYIDSAYCDEAGPLFVELPDRKYQILFEKNLHLSEYALFYLDLRKNAVARATAFLEGRDAAE